MRRVWLVVLCGLTACSSVGEPSSEPTDESPSETTIASDCTPRPSAVLRGCDLAGADLTGADLAGADLAGADLTGADLTDADLTDADLTDADLTDASLCFANLSDADLSDAILTRADLTLANVSGAIFHDANLSGVNLTDVSAANVKLSGANLVSAYLLDADLTGAYLNDANLTYAKLNGAKLNGANLTGANLTGARLTGTKLRGADLTGADFTDANFDDADHTAAKLDNVIGLSRNLYLLPSDVTTSVPNRSWFPRNFETWYDDSNLAWRWAEKGEFNCSYGDGCQAIFVVSKNGCASGLYAKIVILDSSKVVVDYSNDLLSGIRPGDVAKMQFEFFTSGSVSTRLEELSCY